MDKESNLFDDLGSVEQDILDCLENRVNEKWDSNNMKLEIQELIKKRHIIQKELFAVDEEQILNSNTLK